MFRWPYTGHLRRRATRIADELKLAGLDEGTQLKSRLRRLRLMSRRERLNSLESLSIDFNGAAALLTRRKWSKTEQQTEN